MVELSDLPGADLIVAGLDDLAAGRDTAQALLVAVAASRLRRLGLPVATFKHVEVELGLYHMLCREDPKTGYSRYNSMLRRLDSFASALEREQGKSMRQLVSRPGSDGT